MGKLRVSKKLQGDYGELIFEHFSKQNNYAYITLEEIYRTFTPRNKLVFRYGYERIEVDIPDEIVEEVRSFCKPTNKKEEEPSFVFDYLTVSIRGCFSLNSKTGVTHQSRPPIRKSFNWVEIKTGKAKLSKNQKAYIEKSLIGVSIFKIPIKLDGEIPVLWDKKYHPERYKNNSDTSNNKD